ncbi:unnamed protein product [Lymnaea stagnalis]|uniref:Uncharacterized protein n=1 Tax=Lymnaea stagnalis TaxID=6523 RepID=A0AAV2HVR4_LYMST
MRPYGLLCLVIALMYSPRETSCIIIYLTGFVRDPNNKQTCFSPIKAQMDYFLSNGETFENLPSHIVCQYKCPYFLGHGLGVKKGAKDGSWVVGHTVPLKSCATSEAKSKEGPIKQGLRCYTTEIGERIIRMELPKYYTVRNCNIRVFLADVQVIEDWLTIIDDHGLKGLSQEIRLKGFSEAQSYYDTKYDYFCDQFYTNMKYAAVNSVPGIRSRKDVLLMFHGLAMAIGVLSA